METALALPMKAQKRRELGGAVFPETTPALAVISIQWDALDCEPLLQEFRRISQLLLLQFHAGLRRWKHFALLVESIAKKLKSRRVPLSHES
jgi:hypothetical protein